MSTARLFAASAFLTLILVLSVNAQVPGVDSTGLFIHLPLDGDYRETARGRIVGEPHGIPLFTPGPLGQALVLNGQQNWVDLVSDAPLISDRGATIELWAHGEENLPPYAMMEIVELGPLSMFAQFEAPGRYSVAALVISTRGAVRIDGAATFSALRWTHIALVYDAQARQALLYVNGALSGHADGVVAAPIYHRDTLTLSSPRETSELHGAIDDVRIYDHARSAAEIGLDARRAARLPGVAFARGATPAPRLDPRRTNQASDTVSYFTVFNVLDGYPHWAPAITFPIIGLVLVALLVMHLSGWVRMPRPIPSIITISLLVLLMVILPSHLFAYRDFKTMRDAMQAGRFTMVEGRVEEFRPPRRLKKETTIPESFLVHSHERDFRYSYLESQLAPGFNRPSDRGGPVRNRLRVRIADVDGRIARLEIAPDLRP